MSNSAALPYGGPLGADRDPSHPLGGGLGWLFYLAALCALWSLLPPAYFATHHRGVLILVGLIGAWRYGLGIVHFTRAMIFMHGVFPRARDQAGRLGASAMPSHAYFLVTSYRIEAETTAAVYRSVIQEAAGCGVPATIVASIVELADERLILALWERLAPPAQVTLRIVRIAGTGKRDGLAAAFRVISRTMPDERAIVAVVDGDTVLRPGVIRKTAPFLALFSKVGAVTTNEFCRVRGSYIMSEWHKLRFAQRHINMCSMALSRRVLTMTGRMSVFRAEVVTDARFIADVEHDALDHWRLGRFRFLTGDDKSSWYSLMRMGWDTYYVPDTAIDTLESPPDPSFLKASRMLMFRWYGNALRQNVRATRLSPARLGAFAYYVLLDQRVSMWSSLLGLTGATLASFKYGGAAMTAYLVWVGVSRLYLTLMLTASGHRVGPAFPLLLYYNQIVGSLMKIYVFFHLDQQSWTRQKTTLHRELGPFQSLFNTWSSRALMFSAGSLFVALVLHLV